MNPYDLFNEAQYGPQFGGQYDQYFTPSPQAPLVSNAPLTPFEIAFPNQLNTANYDRYFAPANQPPAVGDFRDYAQGSYGSPAPPPQSSPVPPNSWYGQSQPASLGPIFARQYAQPQTQQRVPISYAPRTNRDMVTGPAAFAAAAQNFAAYGASHGGDPNWRENRKINNVQKQEITRFLQMNPDRQAVVLPNGLVQYRLAPAATATWTDPAYKSWIRDPNVFHGQGQTEVDANFAKWKAGMAGPSSVLGSPSSVFGPSFTPPQYAPPSFQSPQLDLSWLYQLLGQQSFPSPGGAGVGFPQGGYPV